jgi:hypothetical protein
MVGCLNYRPCCTDTITWQEFTESFRSHHIPAGVMRLKKKEFLSLKQEGMLVAEYQDRFIELSRYAPEEVVDDPKKQERFLEGLAGPLRYQLTAHTFPSFQQLLDKAIVLESMRKELGELKRKASTPGPSGSDTHPLSYGPPWARYLSGYQDRLLGGPLGLPGLRYTAPEGVEHKDYTGVVLG